MKIKSNVSVIIPTFNRASYLYSTLLCLCNQKDLPCEYEIVIIDSGDDDTFRIVQNFQKKFQVNIKYKKIHKCRNRSLVRNKGVELAQYDILCFLDNDMLVPPDFINRHFSYHLEKENLVVMQCRRLLTQFNIEQIGEEALLSDFSILEKLPWYMDERLEVYEETDEWRFVFSHTLSMKKSDFIKAGKFNKKFGEHWGFEDLELGFKLMKNGCVFKLIKDSFTYHQPHFSQSSKEQNETRYNKDLFTKLHNFYEPELYSTFYIDYGKYKTSLFSEENNSKIKIFEKIKFDKVVGFLNSQKGTSISYKYQLGTYIPELGKKINRTLILDNFFNFDILIQITILSEVFRTSKKVFFHKLSKEQEKYVGNIANKAGYRIILDKKEKYTICKIKEKCYSSFFTMTLPEVYSPEKRYVYTWLCNQLNKCGKYIFLSDMHNTKKLDSDDLRLSKQDMERVNQFFNNYLGNNHYQVIHSSSMINTQTKLGITNNNENLIFHDDDFYINYQSLKYRGIHDCIHFIESQFADISFLSVIENCKNIHNDESTKEQKNIYIVFMENGFYEDGIDIILNAFSKYTQKKPNAKLKIKKPNYESLFDNCLPWHNKTSKNNKLFSIKQKYHADIESLNSYVKELDISKNIEVISTNISMFEAIELINESSTLLFMSRGCYVSPEVYAAICLNKQVILGEHHVLVPEMYNYVKTIESQKCSFSNELKVPLSCMNAVYSAFRCDEDKLFKELETNRIKNNENLNSICNAIEKRVRNYLAFVESK